MFFFILLTFVMACSRDNDPEKLTDFDGNTYKTVQIGKQVWMAENLRTTYYSDGTSIPQIEEVSCWSDLSIADRAYCYSANSMENEVKYGVLYTWAAAMNGVENNSDNIQGVCPDGWHIPQYSEWTELAEFLGGERFAGGKMKETGTTHWNSPNTEASNESAFTGLPGGYRYAYGDFTKTGSFGYFWSATVTDDTCQAMYHSLYYTSSQLYLGTHYKSYGFSVRCIKD